MPQERSPGQSRFGPRMVWPVIAHGTPRPQSERPMPAVTGVQHALSMLA